MLGISVQNLVLIQLTLIAGGVALNEYFWEFLAKNCLCEVINWRNNFFGKVFSGEQAQLSQVWSQIKK